MRRFGITIAILAAVGCSGHSNPGVDICSTQIPPPAACMTACDPSPGAFDTCPQGYHCTPDGTCDALCLQGSDQCGSDFTCTTDGNCVANGGCSGIACQVASCTGSGQSPTTITGTVFAPNGTLPLYDVTVYVPNSSPGAFPDGVQCNRCDTPLPGDPIVSVNTLEDGTFSLQGIPSGDNIPVVITIGKWRREIVIPHVDDCSSTAIAATDTTLPKSIDDMTPNTTHVDMPKIAISTGDADALECLIRKLGIADKEIGTAGGTQHVHLYADTMSGGEGVSSFQSGFAGGTGDFADSQSLWNTTAALSAYDIVFFSCEGAQYPETKSQAALSALEQYSEAGGRVFLSHWHNIWIGGAQSGSPINTDWQNVAQWDFNGGNYDGNDTIDEPDNPKGMSFATWMLNVGGSTVRDQVVLESNTGRSTATGLDKTEAQEWVYTADGGMAPQMFQFVTSPAPNPPVGDSNSACGKVAFSDMHVSGDSTSPQGGTYPDSCSTSDLTPQEKALAFMFFDIASCVGTIQ